MSLAACLPDLVKKGEIDPQRAKRMGDLFDELERHYARSMGREAAAAEASEATLRQLAGEARLKKRQTLLQISRQREAIKDIARHRDGVSYKAVRAMLDDDAAGAPYTNVTRLAQIITFDAHRRMREFIERHRRALKSSWDQNGLWDVVREMHGEATGNDRAKLFAEAIAETSENLRQRFNQAGGNIRKLEHWFPHRWDALKVRMATADEWVATMMPRLDRARMIDETTSLPFTDARLREVLLDVRETIRTNGLTGEASAAFKGPGKLANQHAEHRFLHFTDANGWREANTAFGAQTDHFAAIMGHVDGMAQDIAQMERFGPNPDATMRYLLDHVAHSKAKAEGGYSADVAGRSGGRVMTEQLWRYVKGEGRTPIVPDSWLQGPPVRVSQAFDVVRNTLTAAMLGSSQLSAISDIGTQIMAHKFNGLPVTKVLAGYLRQLNPASAADRRLAIRLGLGMRDASHAMLGINRYMGTATGPSWSAVLPDAVLRASGINKFTEGGQRAFGVHMLGELGEHRARDFKDLPDRVRNSLERYGIDVHLWAAIRHAEPVMHGEAAFVDASAITDRTAADRLMTMVLAETNRAVQDSSTLVRATLTANQRPGTWGHLLTANSTQFLGFGIGLLVDQGRRIAAIGGVPGARYAASFFVGMTMFGALSVQLREIAKGRDPRPMDNAEFWEDAALQSGGLGILGDVVGQFENGRLSHNFLLFGGPIGALAGDVYDAVGQARGRLHEDGTRGVANPGGAAVRLARRYTPGTNLWYIRAALDRMVWDELDARMNPNHELGLARQQKTLRKNQQGAWWPSGQPLPSRAPDLANALGAEPVDSQ